MRKHLKYFAQDESGVVSVDWIVMCFGILCFGCLAVGTARDGTFGLADSISNSVAEKKVEGVE